MLCIRNWVWDNGLAGPSLCFCKVVVFGIWRGGWGDLVLLGYFNFLLMLGVNDVMCSPFKITVKLIDQRSLKCMYNKILTF